MPGWLPRPQDVLGQPEGFIGNNLPKKPRMDGKTQIRKKTGKRPGLYLRVPSKESREFVKAQQYLEIFEGETPVYFFFLDSKKLVCAPQRLWISFNRPLYAQLGGYSGRGKCSGCCPGKAVNKPKSWELYKES